MDLFSNAFASINNPNYPSGAYKPNLHFPGTGLNHLSNSLQNNIPWEVEVMSGDIIERKDDGQSRVTITVRAAPWKPEWAVTFAEGDPLFKFETSLETGQYIVATLSQLNFIMLHGAWLKHRQSLSNNEWDRNHANGMIRANEDLYAFDPETAKEKWKFLGFYMNGPLVSTSAQRIENMGNELVITDLVKSQGFVRPIFGDLTLGHTFQVGVTMVKGVFSELRDPMGELITSEDISDLEHVLWVPFTSPHKYPLLTKMPRGISGDGFEHPDLSNPLAYGKREPLKRASFVRFRADGQVCVKEVFHPSGEANKVLGGSERIFETEEEAIAHAKNRNAWHTDNTDKPEVTMRHYVTPLPAGFVKTEGLSCRYTPYDRFVRQTPMANEKLPEAIVSMYYPL